MINLPRFITAPLSLDWINIGIHVAAAFGVMVGLSILGFHPWAAAAINALIFFLREMWQAYKSEQDIWPTGWPWQKWLEWLAPSVAGVIMVWRGIT